MLSQNKIKQGLALLLAAFVFTFVSCEKSRPDAVFNGSQTAQSTASADATAALTGKSTNFGALIQTTGNLDALDFKLSVAGLLGIDYMRDGTNIDRPKTKSLLTTDKKIVLNVNLSTPVPGVQARFADDTVLYKKRLDTLMQTFQKMPEIVVIENEANNALYYSGSASQYIKQLTAALNFFHSRGIKVADAGMTSGAIKYLLLQTMSRTERLSFQQRMGGGIGGDKTARSAAFADSVLNAMRTMNIDYVNFHWYQNTTDTQDLESAVNYIRSKTGKTVITNETGQSDSNNPQVTTAMISKYKALSIPYVLWYSGNSNIGEHARALHFNDGSLDVNGKAYAAEIKK